MHDHDAFASYGQPSPFRTSYSDPLCKMPEQEAASLESAARNFLSTGDKAFADEFQQELKSISTKGPEFLKQVFNRAAGDSIERKFGDVSVNGQEITFSPSNSEIGANHNSRTLKGTVQYDQATVIAQPDKDVPAGDHIHDIVIK